MSPQTANRSLEQNHIDAAQDSRIKRLESGVLELKDAMNNHQLDLVKAIGTINKSIAVLEERLKVHGWLLYLVTATTVAAMIKTFWA